MIRIVLGAIFAASTLAALSGCQSIPARPLGLESSLEALKSREIALQPVLDYARRLSEARAGDETPFDLSDGLSLAEAEAVALWYNPEARISRLEADRAAAVAEASLRWDDPGLELSGGRKREETDGPGGIERSWIGAASLSFTVPLSGRVGAERVARSAEHRAALRAAAEVEWRTLMALRAVWLSWTAAAEQRALLDQHLALVGEFAGVAQSLAQAGELDPGSARMFAIERAQKQALRDSTELRDAGLRAEILQIMGLLPDAPVTLAPELAPTGDPAAGTESDTDAILRHPAVARLAADYEAAEARLRVELRKQYPDLNIAPAYSDEGGESAITLGLGLVPIPVWNANRAGIAEAAAERDIARARAEGMLQQASGELARARARAAAAATLREGLTHNAAPEADLQMAEAQALLKAGEADLANVFQALTQAYTIKQELLDAVLEEQLALVELKALLAPPVPSGTPQVAP